MNGNIALLENTLSIKGNVTHASGLPVADVYTVHMIPIKYGVDMDRHIRIRTVKGNIEWGVIRKIYCPKPSYLL